jgi:hypothetical protein
MKNKKIAVFSYGEYTAGSIVRERANFQFLLEGTKNA